MRSKLKNPSEVVTSLHIVSSKLNVCYENSFVLNLPREVPLFSGVV